MIGQIEDILADVTFPGYTFIVGGEQAVWYYIQARFCNRHGQAQYTRKWYVSHNACKNEVVQTALKCVLTSVEHEAREVFRYRGRSIFGPHFDVDKLHALCASGGHLDVRRPNAANAREALQLASEAEFTRAQQEQAAEGAWKRQPSSDGSYFVG